ncbi:MAG: xanthine dehydrogenase family protein molybdopterin-binding subunit, partial [bacterium]
MTSDHRAAEVVAARPSLWVGQPVRRREDPRFLRGHARFVDDIVLPGMLHLAVVRSAVAHAHLRGISTDAARRAPGVVAILTASSLTGRAHPMPVRGAEGARVAAVPHPLLGAGPARYVGEPVAAVLADSLVRAKDAAALVEIDYDSLPAVVDPAEALRGKVLLHDTLDSNVLV